MCVCVCVCVCVSVLLLRMYISTCKYISSRRKVTSCSCACEYTCLHTCMHAGTCGGVYKYVGMPCAFPRGGDGWGVYVHA